MNASDWNYWTTRFFILLIVILSIVYIPWQRRKGCSAGNLNSYCSILTSLGVLGTFVGIYLGLQEFQTANIADSVPLLLEGLKTAFVTSIAGLTCSLLLKPLAHFFLSSATGGNETEITSEELLRKIVDISEKDSKTSEALVLLLGKIEKSISGDGETTMLTQLQKFRTSTQDSLAELNKSFREFADKVVADSTQSLIDALTAVMKDFNSKINEQFGDNFKELNDAVAKMLDWQKKYADHVDEMELNLQKALESIEVSQRALSDITVKAESYQRTSEELQKLLSNLNTNLIAIDEIARNSKNAFPKIDQNIRDLTDNLKHSIESLTRENQRSLENSQSAIEKQTEALRHAQDEMVRSQNELNARTNQFIESNSKRMMEQLTKLDAELANELNKALNSLGSQLVSLSNRFVADYTPLTENLQRLVQMSRKIS
jgi:DNA repair exonuclease SbcCD ATPase subunit